MPAARAADASGLLTTTVQLGQLLGVAAIGSVYLSRAGSTSPHRTQPRLRIRPGSGHAGPAPAVASAAATSAAVMSGTACWLAALSAAGLLAAAVMVRAARGRRPHEPSRPPRRRAQPARRRTRIHR